MHQVVPRWNVYVLCVAGHKQESSTVFLHLVSRHFGFLYFNTFIFVCTWYEIIRYVHSTFVISWLWLCRGKKHDTLALDAEMQGWKSPTFSYFLGSLLLFPTLGSNSYFFLLFSRAVKQLCSLNGKKKPWNLTFSPGFVQFGGIWLVQKANHMTWNEILWEFMLWTPPFSDQKLRTPRS